MLSASCMRAIARVMAGILLAVILMPAAAGAMSTEKEIAQGQDLNRQVDDQSMLVTDPFLSNWVNGVGSRLARNRARQEITYRFEIINSDEINAFALPGGYMHADIGLLNFVNSDDELAAVLGHEMGHVERRHVVTLGQKANILGILIGVLSILSPIAYALGGYGGDLAFYKFSRQDELQADQYGLLLMTRAGYDPHANVDLMAHLDKLESSSPGARQEKALLDHPRPKDRIAHLLGYPELNKPSVDQITAQAIHDEQEGRFSYARGRLLTALKQSPDNQLARSHVTRNEIALHESGAPGQLHERSLAYSQAVDAGVEDVAAQLARAQNIGREDARLARDRGKSAQQDIESLFSALESQTHSIPNLGSPKKKGNNLSKAIEGLNHLTRDINGTLDVSSDVIATAPKLTADNQSPLKDLADAISEGPPTAKTRALLPLYPSMIANLSSASDQFVAGIDSARAAISMGSDAVHQLTDFLAALNALDTSSGDIAAKDMPRVQAALNAATTAWDAAAATAANASDITYAAQTQTLSARITFLDLYSSRERYDAYRSALAYRFAGVQLPDYETVLRSGASPGELGCSSWVSYETKSPLALVLREAHATGLSCADLALRHHLMAESMEIAEGLLYENYVDEPAKV
ncbi:MAG: M48 family metalloprotease [Candidatus Eremiobacter antarcticus]